MNTPNTENYENKLTPAARKALSDLVDDYRNQILLGAIKSASSLGGEIEEISVRDIYAGSNEVNTPSGVEMALKQRRARRGIILGVAYTMLSIILGITINLISSSSLSLGNPFTIMFLALGLGGIAVSVVSYLLYQKYSRSERTLFKTSNFDLDFIQRWRDIEIVIKDIVASSAGESKAEKPLSYLIRDLKNNRIIDLDEENLLLDLLKMRNQVVHGTSITGYKQEDMEISLEKATKLLRKLSSILDEKRDY